MLQHAGYSQNYGPLLVKDHIMAPNDLGYPNKSLWDYTCEVHTLQVVSLNHIPPANPPEFSKLLLILHYPKLCRVGTLYVTLLLVEEIINSMGTRLRLIVLETVVSCETHCKSDQSTANSLLMSNPMRPGKKKKFRVEGLGFRV